MARTTVTVQEADSDGIVLSYEAATADGLQCANDGDRVRCVVKNSDGSDHDVEFPFSNDLDGETPGPKTVSITAGTEQVIGPFKRNDYNTSGLLFADFPVQTGMSMAVHN